MKVRDRFDKSRIGDLVCDGAYKYVNKFAVEIDGKRVAEYDSLDGVVEEWEDYKPAEPLIKNEKIRKAVRAWAEAIGETQVQVTHCRKHILSIWGLNKENGNIDFDCDIEPFDEGFYAIAELCGEEEE